jgi:hypothetical protein
VRRDVSEQSGLLEVGDRLNEGGDLEPVDLEQAR